MFQHDVHTQHTPPLVWEWVDCFVWRAEYWYLALVWIATLQMTVQINVGQALPMWTSEHSYLRFQNIDHHVYHLLGHV